MEIAVLTARLEAQTAQFNTAMAAALGSAKKMDEQLKSLERESFAAKNALKSIKMDASQAEDVRLKAAQMEKAIGGVYKSALAADDAISGMSFAPGEVAKFVTDAKVMQMELEKITRDANEAARATSRLAAENAAVSNSSELSRMRTQAIRDKFVTAEAMARQVSPGGNLGGSMDSSLIAQVAGERNRAELLRLQMLRDADKARTSFDYLNSIGPAFQAPPRPDSSGFGRRDFLAGMTPRRWIDHVIGDLPPNPSTRELIPGGDVKGAERYLRSLGFGIAEGGGGTIGRKGGEGGGGVGAAGSFFRGILPGGRRAGAGAVLTGIGLLAGAGPAAVPAAAGAGVGIAAGMTALLGSAAVLKLAFADISAAAFTSKAAFDALTPAQQSLVVTLKSLDAGVSKPLEKLAAQNLIPRLTDALHTLVSPAIVGQLKSIVGVTATNIGKGAQGAAGILGSTDFADKFGTVMRQDSVYVRDFIVDLGRLTDAFFTVLKAAIPFTNWLNQSATAFSKWIQTLTSSSAASGKLGAFFDKAKQGLQAIGALLMSIIHVAGAFGDAFGFKNSIALIGLFTTAFNGIARFIKANRNVLHDFFGGAIGAIKNVMSLMAPLAGLLTKILGIINKLIGGTNGWRKAFELLLIVMSVRALQGILIKLGSIGVAEELLAGGAAKAAFKVGGLRAALLALGGADVLAALAAVIAPLAVIAAAIVPIIAFTQNSNTATYDVKGSSTTPGGTVFQAQDGKWYLRPTGSRGRPQEISAAEAARLAGPGHAVPARSAAAAAAVAAAKAAASGANSTATGVGFAGIGGGISKIVGAGINASLALPKSIQYQIDAASAGHGNMTTANAKAYAYYQQLLNTPGLSAAQKDAIHNAQALYTPGAGFQQSGGGGIGFHGPTSAGGSVFNAQQAVAQAMTAGSGASVGQQLAAARAYQHAASKAYEALKARHVVAKDAAAKAAELTTLARDEASAQKDITTILERQAKARAKMVDDARKLQITEHGSKISAIRAALTGALGISPQGDLAASNRAIRAASAQLEQLQNFKKVLEAEKQTAQLKKEENQIQKEINQSSQLINKANRDQVKALKAITAGRVQAEWSKLLGIGPGATPSAQGIVRAEHSTLTKIMKEAMKGTGPHRKGVAATENEIPGFASMSVAHQIKALQEHGVKFSKRGLEDFKVIQKIVSESMKTGIKILPTQADQIKAYLKQIEQNTNPRNHGPATYHLASLKTVMANLTAIKDPGKRKAAAEKLLEMEIYGGMLPKVHAVAGVPIFPQHPMSQSGTGPHARQIQMMSVTIHINGHNKDPRELAREVRAELLKTRRHNSPQTRGLNGGRSVGLA